MVPMSVTETSIPSLFTLDSDGTPVIGEAARTQKNPAALISASKRLIGRNFHRAEELQQLFTYDIMDGGEENALIPILDRVFTLEEISAAIIKHLCQIAYEHLGEKVLQAVLTVPTYFDQKQRSAIKKAGELAGLDVLRILNEPTAAALAYGNNKKIHKKVAVYDLGGGTFDLSLVSIQNKSFEVLASGGNPQLGGVDFDDRILRFFLEYIFQEHGFDLAFDKRALQTLREIAERTKIQLSTEERVSISIPLFVEEEEEEFTFSYTLTRTKLEELTIDLIETTISTTMLILEQLNYTPQDLDEVLLVGGQSLMPRIHQELEKALGYSPSKNVHPKEVVAKGAAFMADAIINKDTTEMNLRDRLPMTIGVRKNDGSISPLFPQGTVLPAKTTRIIPTLKDNQQSFVLQLYQGNNSQAHNNEALQIFVFSNIRPAAKGVAKVETIFSLNEGGLLRVKARDKTTKQRIQIQAISPAQFTALQTESTVASLEPKTDIAKKETILPTKESVRSENLPPQDLVISYPFVPNENFLNSLESQKTSCTELSSQSSSCTEEKTGRTPPPQEDSTEPQIEKQERLPSVKNPLQKNEPSSVTRRSGIFPRILLWFSSLFGRK